MGKNWHITIPPYFFIGALILFILGGSVIAVVARSYLKVLTTVNGLILVIILGYFYTKKKEE